MLSVLEVHEEEAYRVSFPIGGPRASFSPDSRHIVTASLNGTVRVWDAETFRVLHVLRVKRARVNSAVFSHDGRSIVTANDDFTVRVWDVESERALRLLEGHKTWIFSAVFSPDDKRIVTACDDSTARVWDAGSGRALHVLAGHEGDVNSAAFSPDGCRMVTASDDGTARVWRRIHPEWWWGVFWLPQCWFTVLFAVGFAWSIRRDYKRLMRVQPS